ncbi:MAG TPA: tryptophan--tRNA ligase [Candidatus Dojkabacteria bacterium]|nr:tryptophan--tRNA ligase [Candidatus Dojkabacteria bacterium]
MEIKKKRILTGDRPTGRLHLGHFIGALKQRLDLEDQYEQYIIIADIQALSDNFDNPEKVRENTIQVLLDNLAVGLNPEKTTFYLQSHIPATHELFMYFANFVSIEQLSHNPTIKTELKEKKETKTTFAKSTPLGFFVYPVHQVADIMTVNADLVPVGEDQLPHVELTRDVVKKFNATYKTNLFNVPAARITKISRLVGTDGNAKMSKSLGNCIYISDETSVVRKKIMSMYTDPDRIHATDPGKVEGNPVFIYHDAFNTNIDEVNDLKSRYLKGKVGDVEVKEKLFLAIEKILTPIRERRLGYEKRIDDVYDILNTGTNKVRTISNEILYKTKQAVGIYTIK